MKESNLKKLVASGMLVALIIALSGFYVPVGASKCFPIQHMVNVLSAVLLGPLWGVLIAFCASLIRNLLGTGTLLAFPGSMAGALCCGLVWNFLEAGSKLHKAEYEKASKLSKKSISTPIKVACTCVSEIIGTGVIGGMLAYPVATLIMGKEAALFTYVVPFLISTIGGTLIAAVLISVLMKTHALNYMKQMLDTYHAQNKRRL